MSETQDDAAAAAASAPAAAAPRWGWHEIVAVVLLSAVAVVTAWCGFQASKWGGEMSIAFSEASGARIKAADAAGDARDQRGYDLTIFSQWVVATADGKTDLADYIEERFPPSLAVAFDAWDQKEKSPFALPEYVLPGEEKAAELNAKADAAFASALENNQRGDNYALLTVLFALVLFLTALSQRQRDVWAQRTLLFFAIAVALVGVVVMLTFPIRI